jgi:hypothetical protein
LEKRRLEHGLCKCIGIRGLDKNAEETRVRRIFHAKNGFHQRASSMYSED